MLGVWGMRGEFRRVVWEGELKFGRGTVCDLVSGDVSNRWVESFQFFYFLDGDPLL